MGWLLIRLGPSPRYAVVLEVPGRKSGLVRRTALVRVELGGSRYLVSLSGESEWVRNVRAAGGRVVVGRRRRYAAVLVEVPPAERPAVLRAYLGRARRVVRSWGAANEARHYFGVSADPSAQELAAVADRYPVFRIVEPATGPSGEGRRSAWPSPATVALDVLWATRGGPARSRRPPCPRCRPARPVASRLRHRGSAEAVSWSRNRTARRRVPPARFDGELTSAAAWRRPLTDHLPGRRSR